MQRLKLEGTPRVRRTKRQPAPLSPVPADTELADFMMPTTTEGSGVDYGTVAQRMMNDIFAANGMSAAGSPQIRVEDSDTMPVSPSPVSGDLDPLSGSPNKASDAMMLAPDTPLRILSDPIEEESEDGDRTINLYDTPRL